MMEESTISKFVEYLKRELNSSDRHELNILESLIDYYNDFPPQGLDDPDSDFFREEVERLADNNLPFLQRYLMENENSWLSIDDGKFKLEKSEKKLPCKTTLEQNLTEDELKLKNKHFRDFNTLERNSLLSLYEHKIEKYGTENEKYQTLRLLCNSYQYSSEVDSSYLKALEKVGPIASNLKEIDSFLYFETSAKLYREKYEHHNSAEQFKLAIRAARGEKAANKTLVYLTRSMRIQYELAGDEENASAAFVEENKLKRVLAGKREKSILYLISDYCQNPNKVAYWALGLILFSTLAYSIFGLVPSGEESQSFSSKGVTLLRVVWDALYFSIVTFTTLGYGDFSPSDGVSRVIANIESLGGLFLTSLYLVSLVKKHGR